MTSRGKILVVRPGAIGDICMMMPVVQALSRIYEVHWLIRQKHMAVAQRFPDLACRLIGMTVQEDKRNPFAPELVRSLADENYDCLLDCCHWPIITWLAERLPAIPVRAVTIDPPQDALLGIPVDPEYQARAFNRLVPVPSALHQQSKWCRLARAALGVDIEPDWVLPTHSLPPPDRPLRIFLHPHAGKVEKIWPAERFAEVISGLGRCRKVHCVINRGSGRITRALRWRLFFSRAAVEILPLDPSFRKLRDALERSDVAIGCDSGPMHFASLMGVPTLVIYGPYPALEFAPPWRSTALSPPDPKMTAAAVSTEHVRTALDRLLDGFSGEQP